MHVIFWSLYFVVQAMIWMSAYGKDDQVVVPGILETIINHKHWGWRFWSSFKTELLNSPGKILAVYFNLYVLIPLFLFKYKLPAYLALVFLLLILGGIFQALLTKYIYLPVLFSSDNVTRSIIDIEHMVQYCAVTALVVTFTGAIKFLRSYYKQRTENKELEKQQLATELRYLKQQVNPHFFFNTLNSLYGLSLDNSAKTPEAILQLSSIMHYVLHESNKQEVPVADELIVIENFIELEKLRYADRLKLKFEKENINETVSIAPLLLLPLVENAFKHSLQKVEKEKVDIFIKGVTHGQDFIFSVTNTAFPEVNDLRKASGIGLENLNRRLELLYPGQFVFTTTVNKNLFTVTLEINRK